MTQPQLDFDAATLTVAPSAHLVARETSALAAAANVPARATQNARILELITAAGADGMSDAELAACTGYLRASICARRRDLAPFITVGARRAVSPWGRPMATWVRR